ncbi:MAG: ABC transporter permease [Gemmatimonadaceae bacterium]|nr:ABC transporter permease [Gemmatimonadaceae bacterium]MDQ3518116.1 ABC transporter permease [Gemmatimonadota bacterium]
MRQLEQLRESAALAIDTLRASKLRSGLTILGVVIGVATVMAMAAIIQGIQEQIIHSVEIAGPTTFYVVKIFSQTPLNPDALPKHVRIRPDVSEYEAERLARLPEISYASLWAQVFGRIEYKGVRTQQLIVYGADDRVSEIIGGELVLGRWFTKAELTSGAPVIVVEEGAASKVMGAEPALGKTIHALGRPARIIGLFQKAANIFEPPSQEVGAIVPYRMAEQRYTIDKTNSLFIAVKPREGVTAPDAQDAVMATLRNIRGLRPGNRNNFDFISQDQILDLFNKLTGAFFIVMLVLSSVGLLVGGIGVMAIMMVSVTARTREIGIRKAMGATRRDIMLQFLVEACTLTGLGGVMGILVGLAFGQSITRLMGISAGVPLWSALIAAAVSVGIGLAFGLLPANRAARLDPIEALRYE